MKFGNSRTNEWFLSILRIKTRDTILTDPTLQQMFLCLFSFPKSKTNVLFSVYFFYFHCGRQVLSKKACFLLYAWTNQVKGFFPTEFSQSLSGFWSCYSVPAVRRVPHDTKVPFCLFFVLFVDHVLIILYNLLFSRKKKKNLSRACSEVYLFPRQRAVLSLRFGSH